MNKLMLCMAATLTFFNGAIFAQDRQRADRDHAIIRSGGSICSVAAKLTPRLSRRIFSYPSKLRLRAAEADG